MALAAERTRDPFSSDIRTQLEDAYRWSDDIRASADWPPVAGHAV